MTRGLTAVVLAASVLLVACTEKPQTTVRKADVSPYAGNTGTHTAAGWKAGDATSWEAQLKTRSQGQNEYSRASAP